MLARVQMTIVGALTGLIMLGCAGGALAAGPAVDVGSAVHSGPPSVAVDGSGTAYVAWADQDPAAPGDSVGYCVLPAGQSACSHAGTLDPADSATHIDDVQVVADGSTIIILADVYGGQAAHLADYIPEQEWSSSDGGVNFTLVDGGLSVAEGIIDNDTEPLNALVVPGTGELGFGWDTAQGAPTFDAFPESSPPECSTQTCPAIEAYSTLEPDGNPDQVGNGMFAQFAAELSPTPSVLGIFFTDFTSGPLGCPSTATSPAFGVAFAYGTGDQSSSNSYDISPGSANSAWSKAVTLGDCDVDHAAVDGGPSGFGVLEDNENTGQTVYRPFDQANQDFDAPEATVSTSQEEQASVSQDGGGGVYAVYLDTGSGGPIALSYSHDGGPTWSGPNVIDADSDGGVGDLTSSVNANGQGFAAWTDNGSVVYAQSFTAGDSVPPPAADSIATRQTAGSATGANLTVPAGSTGETDLATISGSAAAGATGTVTYSLYSSSSCAAAKKAFSGGSAKVSAGVAGPSAPVTSALAPGEYYWQAVYSGSSGNLFGAVGNRPNSGACGSEVLIVVPPGSIGARGSTTRRKLTVSVSCVETPCSGSGTVTTPAKGGKAGLARVTERKQGKTKRITLAAGKFKLARSGSHKIELGVSRLGRKYLKDRHGRLKVTVAVSERAGGLQSTKITRTITIQIVRAKKKSKQK